jgi:hypothetical protein
MVQCLSGHVIPFVPHPIIKGIVLAGWLLGLRAFAMGQPVSHLLDGINDPVSHVG